MQTPSPSVDETLRIAVDDTNVRQGHPSFAAGGEALWALLEIAAAYQVPAALLRDREPLAVPAPVAEAITV